MEKRLRCKIRLTLNQERGTIDRSIDLEILLFFRRIRRSWSDLLKNRIEDFFLLKEREKKESFFRWSGLFNRTHSFRNGDDDDVQRDMDGITDEREKNRNVRTKIERGNGKKCDIYDSDFRKSLFYRCIRGGGRRRKVKSVKS